ncbi:hypothetical protein IP84_08810 [beta proteobacterium AAP99]|nr:hypothetical protein IP84_08810 [beta proteobacterium AAP99]
MQPIRAPRTDLTPEVIFSPAQGSLSIEGECYPENPNAFFGPIFTTLTSQLDAIKPPAFEVRIRLNYINSASTKAFRQLFSMMDALAAGGCRVSITWEHEEDDDAIQDLGTDLADGLHNIDFHPSPFTAA